MHGNAFAGTNLSHPFTQGGNGNFTANDDQGHQHVSTVQMNQHQQGRTDQKFVGHRIEERAKGRRLIEFARQVAIQPVGDGKNHKHGGGQEIARFQWQVRIKHPHNEWNRNNACPGHERGNGEKHGPYCGMP